jgi:hypothetical protein
MNPTTLACRPSALAEGAMAPANPHPAWGNLLGTGDQHAQMVTARATTAGKAAIGAVAQVKAIDIVLKFGTMSDAVRSLSK